MFYNTYLLSSFLTHFIIAEEIIFYPSKSQFMQNKIRSPKINQTNIKPVIKRSVDPVFHGYPKSREELWNLHFLNENNNFDQNPSLIQLLHKIAVEHLQDCTPVILYDTHVEMEENSLLQNLFKVFPLTYLHGRIDENNSVAEPEILEPSKNCLHFIVFLADVMRIAEVIGLQASSKVVVVARSSQWRVQEFLSSASSRKFVNLLVVGQTFKDDDATIEAPYILYTHKLYTDGLGSSQPVVLTSWIRGKLTRPEIKLFPEKMKHGYAGHRFAVAAAHQPPFVFRRIKTDLDGGNPRVIWDGIELRILKILATKLNFSLEIIDPVDLNLGSGDAVASDIKNNRADIGVAGLYLTSERLLEMDMSFAHSSDCATFITLMSTALPRYRAIMGPFHWHVWLALTLTYLIGIFPLAFSDKHTLTHLWKNPGEIENMFWYVFGTFTNCFTFVGKNSWSKTTKITTRLLIGWYWVFSIIITSCYTGSIIAFVTLPVFPSTADTVEQLLEGFYRIGTLERGGWERWFFNSSDKKTNKLLKRLELVPDITAGIRNTTKAFFWPYAFLGSKAELQYMVQANFSATTSKRAVLHISDECLVPFGVAIAFPNQSIYADKINAGISRMFQTGLLKKLYDEVRWEIQRSPTGKHLAVLESDFKISSADEKGLTLDDTQGMFLLLGAGFLIAAGVLLSEWMGGCNRKCQFKGRRRLSHCSDFLPPTEVTNDESDVIVKKMSITSKTDTSITSEKTDSIIDDAFLELIKASVEIHDTVDFEPSIEMRDGVDVIEWRRASSVEVEREIDDFFVNDKHSRNCFSASPSDRTVSRIFGEKITAKIE